MINNFNKLLILNLQLLIYQNAEKLYSLFN